MKIGLFSGKYIQGGSLRTAVEPLARGLLALGQEAIILDLHPTHSGIHMDDGLPIITLSTRRTFLRRPLVALAYMNFLFSYKMHQRLQITFPSPTRPLPFHSLMVHLERQFIQSCQLDVLYLLHSHNFISLLTKSEPTNVFTAVNFIGFGSDAARGGGWDSFAYQPLLFEKAAWDMQVTVSQSEFTQYQEIYTAAGLPLDKLVCIPHPFDQERYFPLSASDRFFLRYKYGFPQDVKILLYPVQVYPRKNIELALEIIAQLKASVPVLLLVSGLIYDSDYLLRLQHQAQALGIADRVRFLGGVSSQEMPDLYNLADLTLFPSHQETFGHGLVESLACGTPVIGPGYIRPCREILQDLPGAWLADKDSESFTNQVLSVLLEQVDPQSLASAVRLRFGNHVIAKKWLDHVVSLRQIKSSRKIFLRDLNWRSFHDQDLET